MNEPEVDYAKRAVQRKNANNASRRSEFTREESLERQVKVLGDRLALALHIMSDHQQFIAHGTTIKQMEYLEDWVEKLLQNEPPALREGGARLFDYYRKAQRYGYLKQGIRALLREQIYDPPESPK